jgi:hypothetical protein
MKMKKIFWGLLIIGAAVVLLLNALGIGIGKDYPVVNVLGTLLLLGIAVASIVKRNYVLFFIPLSVAVYLWRVELGIDAAVNIWLLLGAALLLGIGFQIIFHKKGSCHVTVKSDVDWKTEEVMNDNENVNIDASWGEHIKYIHADNLKKAKIKSSFASTKVYFDQCLVSSEGLEINVNGSFCEIVLNIPKDWIIDNRISVFAGAVTDMASNRVAGKTNVILSGNVSFAELKIIYV